MLNRFKVILFFSLIGSLYIGCKHDQVSSQKDFFDITRPDDIAKIKSIKLKGDVLSLDPERLYGGFKMHLFDSLLILEKGTANPGFFEIINVSSEEVIQSAIMFGGGPGELLGYLRTSIVDKEKRIIGIIEPNNLGAYYEWHLDSALISSDYKIKKLNNLGTKFSGSFSKIDNEQFATVSIKDPNRVLITNHLGELQFSGIDYPFEAEMSNWSKDMLGMVFQAELIVNQSKKKIAVFNYASPNWDIIDFSNDSLMVINQFHLAVPVFNDLSSQDGNVSRRSVVRKSENIEGFKSISSNKGAIYSLYSGRTYKKHKDDAYVSNIVLVHDWNGNIINKYELQEDVKAISISEDNNHLYTFTEIAEESMITVYDLQKYRN